MIAHVEQVTPTLLVLDSLQTVVTAAGETLDDAGVPLLDDVAARRVTVDDDARVAFARTGRRAFITVEDGVGALSIDGSRASSELPPPIRLTG